MASDQFLTIQVIYAASAGVWRRTVQLAPGSTVGQAIALSQFAQDNPAYPCDNLKVGIFGQRCSADRLLMDGDRVEVYRPLVFDPMESRRRRAIHREAATKAPDQA
jgi:putative ubiquitin-RnfH superfamily antitoxin RatB of RatAB toxin-antitoxin module